MLKSTTKSTSQPPGANATTMDIPKKVLIIGAGPAGLSCAYRLSKENPDIKVEIYEASPFVGGMSRSFDLWGQRVDLGPHRFFSKEKNINAFFKDLVKDDYTLVERMTRIYYNNRFFDYPLKIFNVLTNLSLPTIISILFHYVLQRIAPIKNPSTFEEWVTNRFGKKLFNIFFKNYTEKLWGIPCSEIDADWAAQRIKTLSLVGAVINAFIGNRGNKHKTLVDQFAYPKNGTGELYERAADFVTNAGNLLHKETPVKKLIIDDTTKTVLGLELMNGEKVYGDYIVSSMPMTTLVKGLSPTPKAVQDACAELYFRNTTLVYLEVDSDQLFKDNWIYVHSPEVKHGRITNFRNWCPSMNRDKKTSILCLEYWSFNEDEMWSFTDEQYSEMAIRELRQIELVPDDVAILNTHVHKIAKCYPVYETGYSKNLDVIVDHIKQFNNLLLIGRYGAFKYNNQDHSILMGLLAADLIQGKGDVDLWTINTDTEYQEEGKIKDVLIQ